MYNSVIPDSGYEKEEKPAKKGLGFGEFISSMKALKENE